jgi:hypothetical protein
VVMGVKRQALAASIDHPSCNQQVMDQKYLRQSP